MSKTPVRRKRTGPYIIDGCQTRVFIPIIFILSAKMPRPLGDYVFIAWKRNGNSERSENYSPNLLQHGLRYTVRFCATLETRKRLELSRKKYRRMYEQLLLTNIVDRGKYVKRDVGRIFRKLYFSWRDSELWASSTRCA